MTIEDIIAACQDEDARFRRALKLVLDMECEFLADGKTIRVEKVPGDSGGITFAGIDAESHPRFPFDKPTTYHVWKTYFDCYWQPLYCSQLPSPVGEVLFSQGVNQGTKIVTRMLQLALNDYGANVIVDSSIGNYTIQACWTPGVKPEDLSRAFLSKSKKRYAAIVAGNPSQEKFLHGWNNRVFQIQQEYQLD